MDDEFKTLRDKATKKRDKIIAAARKEYNQTVRRIRDLQRHLAGAADEPVSMGMVRRPTIDLIIDVLPRDGEYTTTQVVELLTQHEPGFMYNLGTVRHFLQKLAREGIIRRARKSNGFTFWTTQDLTSADCLYSAWPMARVCVDMLTKHGPTRVADLAVALHELGYRREITLEKLIAGLRIVLNRGCHRFREDGDGRWAVIG